MMTAYGVTNLNTFFLDLRSINFRPIDEWIDDNNVSLTMLLNFAVYLQHVNNVYIGNENHVARQVYPNFRNIIVAGENEERHMITVTDKISTLWQFVDNLQGNRNLNGIAHIYLMDGTLNPRESSYYTNMHKFEIENGRKMEILYRFVSQANFGINGGDESLMSILVPLLKEGCRLVQKLFINIVSDSAFVTPLFQFLGPLFNKCYPNIKEIRASIKTREGSNGGHIVFRNIADEGNSIEGASYKSEVVFYDKTLILEFITSRDS